MPLTILFRHGVAAVALLLGATLAAGAAAPPQADLDRFDAYPKHHAALANGITLGYLDLGDRNGAPLLLIHGFTDTLRDWQPLLPYLDQHRRLILVDIRGHGDSSQPECCYTRIDFAYDIKLLLDSLGIERADIVGHSLGSLITQTFAEFWPARTRRVVLISSTAGPRHSAETSAADAKPKLDYRAAIAKLTEPIDPESPFMVAWWASPTAVDPEFLRRQRRDAARIPLRVWLAVLDQGLTGADLASTLPRLKAPALLLWGEQDSIFGADDRRSLQAALPAAKVVLYPELGHNPFWEQPQRVAEHIQEFLRE